MYEDLFFVDVMAREVCFSFLKHVVTSVCHKCKSYDWCGCECLATPYL